MIDAAPAVLGFVALRRCVADLQRSATFYCQGLGFSIVDLTPGEIILSLGAQRIVLTEVGQEVTAQQVSGPDLRFQHVAIVVNDMHVAHARVQKLTPVAISRGGPQRLPAASGGVCAFKFRDPDGHALELIEFPAEQGAPYWRETIHAVAGPNLGIDHAAISVSDVERSIAFYEKLGFCVQSRQVNRGPEQARLDGLADAEVEVVALIPSQQSTPHLELLGYRMPAPLHGDGIPPAAADQLVWMTRSRHDEYGATAARPAIVLADPDGHLHRFVSASI
jgi:catechol 2,3-dioxygenase-like lactoylglutathione lyase family enzyme